MTVTGIGGKSVVDGWIKIPVDLGEGVVVEHTLLSCAPRGPYRVLFGKPFLAMIDAKVGMRHDYIEIPSRKGPPIIVQGRKYIGQSKWLWSDMKRSRKSRIHPSADFDPKTVKFLRVTPRALVVFVETNHWHPQHQRESHSEIYADEEVSKQSRNSVKAFIGNDLNPANQIMDILQMEHQSLDIPDFWRPEDMVY